MDVELGPKKDNVRQTSLRVKITNISNLWSFELNGGVHQNNLGLGTTILIR